MASSPLDTSLTVAPLFSKSPLHDPIAPSKSFRAASAIAFIDKGLSDYPTLERDLQPGTQVYELDAGSDELAQMTQILGSLHDVSSVSVFSHGSSGSLKLGSLNLNSGNLTNHRDELLHWGSALTPQADILFYGCNVAAGDTGKAFVNQISQLTGADVAASADLTSSAALGGNWNLEYQTGKIEATPFAAPDYQGTLASFTVNSLADTVNPNDGKLTLREAINAANKQGGKNDIFFNVGGTITLTGSELLINDNLTIHGLGANKLTISGNNASRVFEITKGHTVTLSGLTITQGLARGFTGGGIENAGNLTLRNSTLSNNSADAGGGIENEDGSSLRVTGSTFTGNSAGTGGGILNRGNLKLTSSTFTGNSGLNFAGGIFNLGSVTMTDSTFTNNMANTGGGIVNSGGTMNITGSTFTKNGFTNTSMAITRAGGGIWNGSGSKLTLTKSKVEGNHAMEGGGLFNASDSTAEVTNSTFNSSVSGYGGGIYNVGNLKLTSSTFQGNSASALGGGIDNANGGSLTMTDSTFTNNMAPYGGGLLNSAATVTATGSTFTENGFTNTSVVSAGGGIWNGAGSKLTLSKSKVEGNRAKDGGGLVNDSNGTAEVTNSTFSNNSATSFGGGIENLATLTVTNSTFTGNTVLSFGGGIYDAPTGHLTVMGSTFTGNNANGSGGGIENAGALTVTGSTLKLNDGSSSGGGINNEIRATATVTRSRILQNTAAKGPDVSGTFISGGGNVIGTSRDSIGFSKPGDTILDLQNS
jgi:CSLREA domain-containing protein